SHRVAVNRSVNGSVDLWLLEITRGVLTRFTSNEAVDMYPVWSFDGSRIVFSSNRKGSIDLYEKSSTGEGAEELLLASPQLKVATDWSRDGRFLLYRSLDPNLSYDIWALPMSGANASPTGRGQEIAGDRKPFPVVQTNFDERDAQFAPDGKWIAYQ